MNVLVATLYGFVQGLTEFIPVSSSAHLALIPHFLGIEDPSVHFDLMMHLGTVLALLVYFFKRLLALILCLDDAVCFWRELDQTDTERCERIFYLRNFIVSTVASVLLLFLFKMVYHQYAGTIRSTPFIAVNLALFGLLLWFADWWGPNRSGSDSGDRMMFAFKPKKAALIGVAQAFAIFPGVSRSGVTLGAGRLLGLSRYEVTEYTFFMSIPIIILAALSDFIDSLTAIVVAPDQATQAISILPMIVGVLASFAVGILTIHYFLKLVRKIPFAFFAFYRIILAIVVYWHL